MKRDSRICFVVGMLSMSAFGCRAGASTEHEMTLSQAVRLAVERHPAIRAATYSVEQQAGGVDSARAGYRPQISAGVNTGTATASTGGQTGNHVASVTLSQMLYDFGKVSSRVEQARAEMQRQQALLPKQIDTVAQQAGEAVVGLHRYQALSAIAEEQEAALGRVLELARLRADAGLSSQADPIQALSRLEAAQVLRQQYGAQLRQTRERLRTLLGPEAPATVAPMSPALLEDVRVNGPLQLDALPDVIAAEAELTSAVAALRNARAQGLPTVSLEASVNQALAGTVSGTDGRHLYGTVGIGLSTPLYQGGAQEGAVRSASAAVEAARAQIEVARLNAADQIRALREQINGVQGRLGPLAQRSRTIAQTRELYQEQYKLGTRSVLDLLSAEQEIYQARTDLQTAEHDLWVGLVDFAVVSGAGRRLFGLDVPALPGLAR